MGVGGGGGGMLMKDSTAVHAGQLLGRCIFFTPGLLYTRSNVIQTVCNLETFKMSRDVSFTIMWHV